jgi:hypothetical protein
VGGDGEYIGVLWCDAGSGKYAEVVEVLLLLL